MYAKSEGPDQLAHSRSLVRIFTVRHPCRDLVEDIGLIAKAISSRLDGWLRKLVWGFVIVSAWPFVSRQLKRNNLQLKVLTGLCNISSAPQFGLLPHPVLLSVFRSLHITHRITHFGQLHS